MSYKINITDVEITFHFPILEMEKIFENDEDDFTSECYKCFHKKKWEDFIKEYFFEWKLDVKRVSNTEKNLDILVVNLKWFNHEFYCPPEEIINDEAIKMLKKFIPYMKNNSQTLLLCGEENLDITKLSFASGELEIFEIKEIIWEKKQQDQRP